MGTRNGGRTFVPEYIGFGSRTEPVVRGGRDTFHLLPKALQGVSQIGVVGWGPQGRAQALNLRDSLAPYGIRVAAGLRHGSSSAAHARDEGFTEESGTLTDMWTAVAESDLVLMLIADGAQAELYPRIFQRLRAGSTLGFSHGFLLGHLKNTGNTLPGNVNVIGVCPKGMGDSVRRLYLQGATTPGAGINVSYAVEQDVTGRAADYALAWGIALGAPFCFETTLRNEYLSDIVGERGILLGVPYGVSEALFRYFKQVGMTDVLAYRHSAEEISGPVAGIVSRGGPRALLEGCRPEDRAEFARVYSLSYTPLLALMTELYDEAECGNETRSILCAHQRLERFPMPAIGRTGMWRVRHEIDTATARPGEHLHPVTAGVYAAAMIAQVDVLMAHGHSFSEIINESVIEAVDSLAPYMHRRGIDYMVDNCSITARLGARKWAPRFDYVVLTDILGSVEERDLDGSPFKLFEEHVIHRVFDTAVRLRPSVPVALG